MDTNEARRGARRLPTRDSGREDLLYGLERRWQTIGAPASQDELLGGRARARVADYANNIENYIGTVALPVGMAGPLKVHGVAGTQSYCVPLATTEAALVASYNRGARLLSEAGGCTARVVKKAVSRTPVFIFRRLVDAESFADFVCGAIDRWCGLVNSVTRHGRLLDVEPCIEGNHVYLDLSYATGDASGQNMVTFASEAVCRAMADESPVKPERWFLEANLSGDKKASARALGGVRGRRTVAEVRLPARLVGERLHTTPAAMVNYWYAGAIGGVMSGTTGIHGHFANGIAALYLACGQDVACVAESATGITRLEMDEAGDLYAAVTLPNLMLGTVGGGTGLPSARACLDLLGLAGAGQADALAEVCAALVLGGELSIIAAFCSGDFANAHRCLSRGEPMQRRS
ncbi:MAG: hydroxymethylglutaryl-CoA reductase [Gammaproteobacteria bacterium]|nr:hydroxymethylglutaryl-CoA reductase [Gammaproteobacteria bacterium]MDH4255612.1 hydroxymethylglutaryl-CoA reductase [Gammaproteobacteria bacterium]MDH5310342.1 hydroxymethylglutaryl-CoA reductase [Gammaproteobacteria bacterium]